MNSFVNLRILRGSRFFFHRQPCADSNTSNFCRVLCLQYDEAFHGDRTCLLTSVLAIGETR
jgi:hypothetical protein